MTFSKAVQSLKKKGVKIGRLGKFPPSHSSTLAVLCYLTACGKWKTIFVKFTTQTSFGLIEPVRSEN
jgi:hypothetical protein